MRVLSFALSLDGYGAGRGQDAGLDMRTLGYRSAGQTAGEHAVHTIITRSPDV